MLEMGIGGGYDQDMLHTYLKFSKNKQNYDFFSKINLLSVQGHAGSGWLN